jgi:hypothetical protein
MMNKIIEAECHPDKPQAIASIKIRPKGSGQAIGTIARAALVLLVRGCRKLTLRSTA